MSSNIHVYMYTVGHTFYPSKRNMQKQKSKGRGKCGKWYERVFFFQKRLAWYSIEHSSKCVTLMGGIYDNKVERCYTEIQYPHTLMLMHFKSK